MSLAKIMTIMAIIVAVVVEDITGIRYVNTLQNIFDNNKKSTQNRISQ